MKKKIDLIAIYFGFIFELTTSIIFKYIRYLNNLSVVVVSTSHKTYNEIADLSYNITHVSLVFFYFLMAVYILSIFSKYLKQQIINFKQNNCVLLLFTICDLVLYFFNIKAMIENSYAIRFVIICLLTNLVVYIKYKKNNIKIK